MSLSISELNKLRNIQNSFERNDHLLNFLSKYGTEDNLCGFYSNLETKRNDESKRIISIVTEIWKALDENKSFLQGENACLDPKSFKKNMIHLQDKILNLKLHFQHVHKSLKEQEREFTSELDIYHHKIDEWAKPVRSHFYSLPCKINKTRCDDDDEDSRSHGEVKKFMNFLNKHQGHENGWASEDHQLFLRIKKKYKHIDAIAHHLHKILPDITEDNIRNHEKWYCEYIELKNQVKDALDNWKATKSKTLQSTNPEKHQYEVAKKKSIKPPVDPNYKEKIADWKAEKESKRCRDMKFKLIQKKQEEEAFQKRELMRKEIKKSVEKWKETKLRKQEIKNVEKELNEFKMKKIKSEEANKMIKLFQSQDDIFIGKIKERNRGRDKNQETKRSKSSQLVGIRDPYRLLKPTQQWTHRTARNDNDMDTQSIDYQKIPNIRAIPKLRVPEWRKNM